MKVKMDITCKVIYNLPIDNFSENGTFAIEKRYVEKNIPPLVERDIAYIVRNYIIAPKGEERIETKAEIVFDYVHVNIK